jgi:GNAT superfamily N-acetyltransferase
VWGWICSDGELLHFIYVKAAFRGFGIGGVLFRTAFSGADRVKVSHRTGSLYTAFPGVNFLWNPYRSFYD